MRVKVRKRAGLGMKRIGEPPIQPEQIDVGDRIAADRPAIAQAPVCNAIDLFGIVHPALPRRMQGGGNEGHPGNHLRLRLDIASRQQSGVGKTPRKIKQDRGDLGQRTPVDHEGRDLAFRIELKKFRAAHVVLLERHRLGLEGHSNFIQRDMRGE